MGKIIEAADLPEGDKVYLKKDWLGWRAVEPYKDPITDRIDWFNVITGGKRNLITLGFITIFFIGLYLGINEMIANYKIIAANPCNFCGSCLVKNSPYLGQLNISG